MFTYLLTYLLTYFDVYCTVAAGHRRINIPSEITTNLSFNSITVK